MVKMRTILLASTFAVVLAAASSHANLSYAQCAGCGADYNREDRARVDVFEAGKKQGYEKGYKDGENKEKLVNSFDKLINNAGEMGSAGVKGR